MTEPLATQRLSLRTWRESDRARFVALLTDPLVRRFLGGAGAVAHGEIPVAFDAIMADSWGAFCVTHAETDDVIGSCRLDRGRNELELSYVFRPDVWGRGFAFEATTAVIGWIWSTADDDSLIVVTQRANTASRALLVRLGFEIETTFEEFNEPQMLYRLRRPSWS